MAAIFSAQMFILKVSSSLSSPSPTAVSEVAGKVLPCSSFQACGQSRVKWAQCSAENNCRRISVCYTNTVVGKQSMMAFRRNLSYVIKTQLKAGKAPSWLFPWMWNKLKKSFYCTGGQVSPPSPLAGPWSVSQPGRSPDRTVPTGRASSWSCWFRAGRGGSDWWTFWVKVYIYIYATEKCSVIISAMSRSWSGL